MKLGFDSRSGDIFLFRRGHRFEGKEVDVMVYRLSPPNPAKGHVPSYHCHVVLSGRDDKVGELSLRIGYTDWLVRYGGHIGYGIDAPHRGNRYAAKACQLVKPVFVAHGMDVIWITCNPDNWPSRKTCERIGCSLIDVVDLPEEIDMYKEGERQKCRYRWIILPE